MALQKVKVVSDGTGIGTKVLVDGVQLDTIQALRLDIGANAAATLTLVMHVDEVQIDGATDVVTVPLAKVAAED